MKRFNCSLNKANSIQRVIDELKKYREVTFPQKCEEFVRALGNKGMVVANARVGAGGGDASTAVVLDVKYERRGTSAVAHLTMTSAAYDDGSGRLFWPHLAWEFGAGIYYNNGNINPLETKVGQPMGVGTFPNQRYAVDPGYWWYTDKDHIMHLSLGTEATMPLYNAEIEMIRSIRETAIEVFRS